MPESVSVEQTIKIAMQEGMRQIAVVLEGMAVFAESKQTEEIGSGPSKTIYWAGYMDGLRDAARLAREGQDRLE